MRRGTENVASQKRETNNVKIKIIAFVIKVWMKQNPLKTDRCKSKNGASVSEEVALLAHLSTKCPMSYCDQPMSVVRRPSCGALFLCFAVPFCRTCLSKATKACKFPSIRPPVRPFVYPSVRLSVNIFYPGCLVSGAPLTVVYRSF